MKNIAKINVYQIVGITIIILLMQCLFLEPLCFSADYFDWSTRVDRNGKPAGIFTTTPFPITEASTSYTLTTDEGTTTYTLGTKFYVDVATGVDTGNCKTFGSPCKTIGYAITQTSAATNQTIIVRAGTYTESDIRMKTGTGLTTRSMLVGYGQERPIIDAGNHATNDIIKGTAATNAYIAIQRVKMQNGQASGFLLGDDLSTKDSYVNIIDVHVYNTPSTKNGSRGNAGIYAMNADNAFIHHCTVEHQYGHCIKMGDGADNGIVEWNDLKECGWWAGFPETAYYSRHPMGIDFPSDSGAYDSTSTGCIARYNSISDVLYYGIYTRRADNISFHHNSVTGAARCWAQFSNPTTDCDGHSEGNHQVELSQGTTGTTNFYSNKVYDTGNSSGTAGSVYVNYNGSTTFNIYNNIIYGAPRGFTVRANTSSVVNLFNNSVVVNGTAANNSNAIQTDGTQLVYKGNILYQLGSGMAFYKVEGADPTRSYNLYYYPSGTRGYNNPLETGGVEGNPLFISTTNLKIQSVSPAKDALPIAQAPTTTFTLDFNGETRPIGSAWDIGAYEYQENNPNTALYADFTGLGLYSWNGTAWALLNTVYLESMVASGSTLYADFTGFGLYSWNGSAWTQITTDHPVSGMVASGSTLYADFAGYGLYSWNGSSWRQLTTDHPASGMVASGSTLYADFPGYGLYSWNGSAWRQLTTDHPASGMVASGSTLYADFPGYGLYSWNGSSWRQLTTDHPASGMAASGSTLYADFPGYGFYSWNGSSWSQLTTDHPQSMVASGSILYGDFGALGIYKWEQSAWTQLTPTDPTIMVAGF